MCIGCVKIQHAQKYVNILCVRCLKHWIGTLCAAVDEYHQNGFSNANCALNTRLECDLKKKQKKNKKRVIIGMKWRRWCYSSCSDWCEVTLLMVISFPVKGPPASAAFIVGGDQLGLSGRSVSQSPRITLSTQRKQTVKGGLAGAKRGPALLHVFPALNSLFICFSQ